MSRTPPRLDEKEAEEFDKYARVYYQEMINESYEIAQTAGYAHPNGTIEAKAEIEFAIAIFDKLASPRVYLVEAWLKERARKEAGVTD
jgi:hypothetical protein